MAKPSALVVYSGGTSPGFEESFAANGFEARCVPSHRIEATLAELPGGVRVDRLIFTSRNAAEAFGPAGLARYPNARVTAVGEATRETLGRFGRRGDVPGIASAEGLLKSLPARLEGEFVLWPRGEDADLALAGELRARGAKVGAPSVYRKVPLEFPGDLEPEIRDRKYAAYSCTSGAAARWLHENLAPQQAAILRSIHAAVLGEKTAAVLRGLGAEKTVRADGASFESLALCLLALLEDTAHRSKT